MSAPPKEFDLSHFPVSRIKIAQENDSLYDKFGIANADDAELAISIRDNGIQEPLSLSTDNYLLSGHRRRAAAMYIGIKTVPVRYVDVRFSTLSEADKLATNGPAPRLKSAWRSWSRPVRSRSTCRRSRWRHAACKRIAGRARQGRRPGHSTIGILANFTARSYFFRSRRMLSAYSSGVV